MPDDFLQWHESMCAEFPTRFNRLFRGPMWSGVDENYHGYPIMVSTVDCLFNHYICIIHCCLAFNFAQYIFNVQ
jgi:hypothetical protein